MNHVRTNVQRRCITLFAALFLSLSLFSQGTLTKRPNVPINANINGYLEWLPSGYSTGTQKYPLIVYISGIGSTGNGSEAALENLFSGGGYPHEQQRSGSWVDAYTVNGETHRFVITTPQFVQSMGSRMPTAQEVNDMINYSIKNYRIDTSRIYLVGQSQGGGVVWEYPGSSPVYARRIAAIVQFAGVSWPIKERANNIKYNRVGVWAFHNERDNQVPSYFTKDYVKFINNAPAPAIPARQTIFDADGHLNWFAPLRREYTEGGMDIYEFLLQHKKNFSAAHAGYFQEVTLPVSTVQLTGTGTGPNGTVASYSWTKVSGPAGGTFSNPSIANPVASGLTAGAYVFRLTITDNNGAQASDEVQVLVNGPRTRIQAESYIAMSGIINSSTTDEGGGTRANGINNTDWMDFRITVPAAGNYEFRFRLGSFYSANKMFIKNANGAILDSAEVYNTGGWDSYLMLTRTIPLPAGEQIIRIATVAPRDWYMNWFEYSAAIGGGTPSNLPPTVNAGADQTITQPASSVNLAGTGSDPDGSIASYNWTKVSGPAGSAFGSPNTAATSLTGLVPGTYVLRLTVADNSGAQASDDVVVTVNSGSGPATLPLRIQAESWTAMFGVRTETTRDTAGGLNVGYQETGDWIDYSVNLASAATYNLNFRVATVNVGVQIQIKNGAGAVLSTLTVPSTGGWQTWRTFSAPVALPAGQQTIRIHTLDGRGSGWNFNWWEITNGSTPANQPPTANAGADKTITLPASSVSLTGSGTDPDGTIATYSWSKVSGPAGSTFSSTNTASTTLSGLAQGVHVLRLTVTDNGGASASDDVTVTVNAAANQAPTVNAGTDKAITLPTNSVQMTATASDADGTVATYSWTKIAGGAATFSSTTVINPTISGLAAGSYTFRLTVTDNANATASDDVVVVVNSAPTPGTTQRIQAENWTTMFGVRTETTRDVDGNLNVGWQENNDWIDYSINIATAGTYTLNFRVATAVTGVQVQLRNAAGTVLSTIAVPNTGGWQVWRTISQQVTLPAGQQTLRVFTLDARVSGWNFNWWEIVGNTATASSRTATATESTSRASASFDVHPNPVQDRMQVTVNNPEKGNVRIQVIDAAGQVVKEQRVTKTGTESIRTNVSLGSLKQGTYFIKVSLNDWSETRTVVKQ